MFGLYRLQNHGQLLLNPFSKVMREFCVSLQKMKLSRTARGGVLKNT